MWKRLISCPPDKHECILLITAIFSDKHEIGVVRSLRGDDAQAFVDVIDEVPTRTLSSRKNRLTNLISNLPTLLSRCWIPWCPGSGGNA